MKYATRYKWAKRLTKLGAPKVDAKLVAKNTLVLYFRMLAVMFVGLFTSRIQLQALGVENYGLYGVAMATVGMFAFINGSLSMASSRFLTVEMGKGTIGSVKRVFSTVLSCQFVMACLIALLLETIGLYVLDSKLNIDPGRIFAVKWAFHCGVISTFLGITQVPYGAVIIAHERMSAFAFMTFYDIVIKLLIVYLLFVTPFDRLVTYSTFFLISSCTTIAIYRIYCIVNFSEARYRRVFDKRIIKEISGFIGWQLLSQLVFLAVTQMVTLLNQRYFGPVVVAAATIGAGLFGHINGFINNFKTAANPQIIKLFAAKEFEKSKDLLIETIHYSVFLLLILGVPVAFYAPEILHLWLGDNVPQYAVEFSRVIICAAFFQNFDYSMFTIIYADGRMKYNTYCDLIFYPITFATIWICIKFFGCPFTTAIGQCGMSIVLAMAVKPLLLRFMAGYHLRDFARMFIPAFAALGVCVGANLLIYISMPNNLWWLVPNCALAAFVNGFLLFSFIASSRVQNQLPKLLSRFGAPGKKIAVFSEKYLENVRSIRRALHLERLIG